MLKRDLVFSIALAISIFTCTSAQAQIKFTDTDLLSKTDMVYADSTGALYEDEELTTKYKISVKCSDPQNNLSGSYGFDIMDISTITAEPQVNFADAPNETEPGTVTINCDTGAKKTKALKLTSFGLASLTEGTLDSDQINVNNTLNYASGRPNPGFVTLGIDLTIIDRTDQTASGDNDTKTNKVDRTITLNTSALDCPILIPDGLGGFRYPDFPITITITTELNIDEEFLELVDLPDESFVKFLTSAEIVAALAKQVGNATINFKLPKSVLRTLERINYNGPKYNLQNSVIDTINTSTAGRITATVTANLSSVKNDSSQLLQIGGFSDKLVKRFVPDADARATLASGGSINADQIADMDKVMNVKSRYKFVKPRGTIFQKAGNKLKTNLRFLIQADDDDEEESE